MTSPNQLPVRVTFGPFEVNTSTGELLKGGTRVRLPAQPFAILLVLLKTPGELVTREQLRDQVWAEGTFVDFEHGLNAAMNKLRRALSDSAENPRYIETTPGRGYRFIGMLDSEHVVPISLLARSEARQEHPGRWRSVGVWERLIWTAGALVCLGVGLRFHNAPAWLSFWTPTPITADAGLAGFQLNQLTRDAGLSHRPALSRDGKLLAYSSDASQDGGMNLYVRQVAGGQPIRLTFDGAGNTWPDFSPDGSKIVFRSNRGGGGIYEIPAFGGQSRLLARGGLRPRFSPDGSKVAYWTGSEGVADTIPGHTSVWVVPATGGQPQRVAPNLTAARAPIWSPDGKRLLFVGYTSAKLYDDASLDWWLAAVDGSDRVKTGLHTSLIRAGLPAGSNFPVPSCWSADTNTVFFSISTGDAQNIWEVGLSPQTGQMTGVPRRFTAGAGIEEDVSCASGGALAFTTRESRSHIWSLPFDLNRGTPTGASERITHGPGDRGFPSLSNNARLIAFFSNQSGQTNIWKRDLATGDESIVASSSLLQRFPVVSRSGARIAFAVNEEDGTRTVYAAAPGGEPEKVCEGCMRATDWSSDEKTLLIYGGIPYQVNLLDVATHRQMPLLKHPTYHLLYGHFSPDSRWVSFTVRTSPTRARVAIAPFDGPRPIPESAWITISDVWTEDWAHWSPDGRTLYFPSERDGHRCLWGQRIDTVSHRPVGEPFVAWHFHGRASYAYCCQNGWSAATGRIAIALKRGYRQHLADVTSPRALTVHAVRGLLVAAPL